MRARLSSEIVRENIFLTQPKNWKMAATIVLDNGAYNAKIGFATDAQAR